MVKRTTVNLLFCLSATEISIHKIPILRTSKHACMDLINERMDVRTENIQSFINAPDDDIRAIAYFR